MSTGRKLHTTLSRYFNGSAFNYRDKLLVPLFPGHVSHRNTNLIMNLLDNLRIRKASDPAALQIHRPHQQDSAI